ncbi:branched-chain amino acid ABC transporter permease (plasmid) [Agrobacterium leguminum]|nr:MULTISPECIES: branched-chain amino acid ABC transporter permease [Agrobacterium]WFS69739.1 branched-chain amino acid ABC transporter permease [Agrobacterium leguminum]
MNVAATTAGTQTPASSYGGPILAIAATLALTVATGLIDLRLATDMLIYLTLAQLWNLLAGYAGLVSVGQQAFVGLGGYGLYFAAAVLGVPTLPAILLGGIASLVASAVASVFIFRLKGAYFAIGTWVIAEICRLSVAVTPQLGGGSGASLPASVVRAIGVSRDVREFAFLTMALFMAIVTILAVTLLLRSRFGIALVAIRDSERAAEALGVDAMRIKRTVYIAVAFMTGVLGALIFLMKLRFTPDAAFSVLDWTAYVLFIVVIGGSGRLEGPFVGTIVFFALRAAFSSFGPIYLVVLGMAAIAVMLFAPSGLWGLVVRWTGFEPLRYRRNSSIN